ncbi:SGNH/GDSL hydrolase family protein [Flavicella sediminum]|uniref:SGNH/GDSL hydrolase family protein n=1 Tax=Flavicella sediminum TaxID=2585141 RepID=UPI001FB62757|nr:SGNH/GDSL hydrolase family protein [Flavicella sediminum]
MLIIGDSISIGYTPFVKEALAAKAEVFHNVGNAQHTRNGLEKIDSWLGDKEWNIIQINWGLWDLCYRNPTKTGPKSRDKVNGVLTNEIDVYAANLEKLVTRIKEKSNAKIIFVTTTYVPNKEPGRFYKDVAKYNAVAKEVMDKNAVIVNDIYEKSIPIHMQFGNGETDVHYSKEGYKELGIIIMEFLEEVIEDKNSFF